MGSSAKQVTSGLAAGEGLSGGMVRGGRCLEIGVSGGGRYDASAYLDRRCRDLLRLSWLDKLHRILQMWCAENGQEGGGKEGI